MSWEWVTLILGIVLLIVALFGWVSWTQMKARMFEAYPKTLPDMLARTKKEEDG
jgi:predicted negative regulator of RcsB-dependent stress response